MEDFPVGCFSSLSEERRSQFLLKLVDTFTPPEKMRFLGRVNRHISGDFLSLLPPELVEEVLSYLTAEDLLHGMQVSRSWYKLIVEAVAPWKAAAKKMGISESLIEENRPKYGSMSALTLAALKHRRCISSSVLKTIPIPGPVEDRTYHYAGDRILLYHTCATIETDTELKVDIKSMENDGTYTLLKRMTGLDVRKEPYQAFAMDNGAVIWRCYGSDAWVLCDTKNDDNHVIVCETDFDHEMVEVCRHCGLMVPSNQTRKRWKLCTLKLHWSNGTISQVTHQLKLPEGGSFSSEKDVRVIVLPNRDAELDDEGFCKTHSLVICFEEGIAFYNFSAAGVSDLVRVLRPRDEHGLGTNGGAFALSHDKKLVGMITSNQKFHVWRLDSDEYAYYVLPTPVAFVSDSCFSVGHLYSVLNCGDTVKVVATFTGEEILSFHYGEDVEEYGLWGPLDVTWLNDFSYYPKPGFWHIASLKYDIDEDDLFGRYVRSFVAIPVLV